MSKTNKTFLVRKSSKKRKSHVKFEWNQVDEFLFVGTNICCKTHFEEELLKKGISGDVSMEAERLDEAKGVEVFLWLPTKDHTAPSLKNLMVGAEAITQMVMQKRKVYIHCKNGHGRGPTMVAAYYIYLGATTKEAMDLVKMARPETHIEPPQIRVLKQFEKKFK